MNVVIMGCGRVGSSVATRLAEEGHTVSIVDTDAFAFSRLPSQFKGRRFLGSGNDHRTLEAVGIREADAFIALASGDNRNILASQRAKHIFGVKTVVTRVKDPQRSELFAQLGLQTFSPTTIGADLAHDALFNTADSGSEA
ncbi:MAG: TrkA family potassium uptake protein [Chloroflexi bacterium]|nr:TrkA family potassium uptake protein [Chloroflexota bacterium]MDA1146803.1 TrkA family potassium uptake protein [Chloroflexota bacterium]MQC82417.1 TrkA family potassium uptake protein [Chloroflexota bacterium]PKB56671.1 MAG: potassium transporter TrkA [SAR202 cluster bacterium Casp-Chloro-G1]